MNRHGNRSMNDVSKNPRRVPLEQSFGYLYPELLEDWDWNNNDISPYEISPGCHYMANWVHSYDVPDDYPVVSLRGKHFDLPWPAKVHDRVYQNNGCPFLSNPCRDVYVGFNDLWTTHPDVARKWHPDKNGDLTPYDVCAGSRQFAWWLEEYDDPNTGVHETLEYYRQIRLEVSEFDCCYRNSSSGESYVTQYFLNNQISVEHEKRFPDLIGISGKKPLRYDFAIQWHGHMVLIEYHGEQHYKPIKCWGGDVGLRIIQANDNLKAQYAMRNGIALVVIPYRLNTYEKIETYLNTQLGNL